VVQRCDTVPMTAGYGPLVALVLKHHPHNSIFWPDCRDARRG
jgi:hypothetical protein